MSSFRFFAGGVETLSDNKENDTLQQAAEKFLSARSDYTVHRYGAVDNKMLSKLLGEKLQNC